jgi:RNA polymerase sporulation-specific sigma factor
MAPYRPPTEYPKPLSAADERKMFQRFCELGDTSARDILIAHNMRLCIHIAQKYSNVDSLDDLIQISAIGLIKAVDTFRLDKNIKFATYASRCIANEILMYNRKVSKTNGVMSLEEPLNTDHEGNQLMLSDIIGDCGGIGELFERFEKEVNNDLVKEAMQRLTKLEREVILLYFSEDALTQREISDRLKLSQSYISRIYKKALQKIRRILKSSI